MNPEAAPVSGLPDVAAMLVIMHRHGAHAGDYTRILADALREIGHADEADAIRSMTRTIARCEHAIAAQRVSALV